MLSELSNVPTTPPGKGREVDVAIVGLGPVGQALCVLLGELGHEVVAVERWPTVFPLPRAGHIDHEVMRILQSFSIAETIAEDSEPFKTYQLLDSAREVLARSETFRGHEALSGWFSGYSMFQPNLESLLEKRALSFPTVEQARGWQAEEITQDDDQVTVLLRGGSAEEGVWLPNSQRCELSARFVVGCDGANSVVREQTGLATHKDLGFEADWLVVFAEPFDSALKADIPDMGHVIDPARPTSVFRASGKRFCRWEFMLVPGEDPHSMSDADAAWDLIAPWGFNPENSRLIRHSVFRFRSLVAERWRSGRAFIAGDAAHQTPPFLGQGLCSGIRDVTSLAWKLDLVLRGISDSALLDEYELERRPHITSIVETAVEIGKIICVTDPARAARRDEELRAGTLSLPDTTQPPLMDGVLLREGEHVKSPAGVLSMQPRLLLDGKRDRLDSLIGKGWRVLATGYDPLSDLGSESRELLQTLKARVLRVEGDASDDGVAVDEQGGFLQWLAELEVDAVIVRPDYYLFGGVRGGVELDQALVQLRHKLAPSETTPRVASSVTLTDEP